jgi:L-ascorbate metabolism protein UlaG (beta-lactamase superfamily)
MAPTFWRRVSQDLRRTVLTPARTPRPKAWPSTGIHAAWIGHSTVLVTIDGFTILTDPVFSRRIGLSIGPVTLGFKRLVAPALPLSEIPAPDLILLSHAHMDHFDLPSLRRLEHRATTVVTATRTADLLRVKRYSGVRELGWDERVRVGPLEIRAFRVNHWGARMRSDTFRGYNGYTIECGRYRVLFGGDTALTSGFRGLRAARPFDLAIMPVGAYNPWVRYHCTPEQSWQMAGEAACEHFLPVHHQTFPLGREPYLEPLERVYGRAGAHADRVAAQQIGQEFRIG